MTWSQNDFNCFSTDFVSCKFHTLIFAAVTGTVAIVIVIYTLINCAKKSKTMMSTGIENVRSPQYGTARSRSGSRQPSITEQCAGPKPDRPGQYYDRVTGKWVEDVEFSAEADGPIMRVINPDPGGRPNIPYDEKNNTDVPVTSSHQAYQYAQPPRVMIPAQYSMRRPLATWNGMQNPYQYPYPQQGHPQQLRPPQAMLSPNMIPGQPMHMQNIQRNSITQQWPPPQHPAAPPQAWVPPHFSPPGYGAYPQPPQRAN